MFILCLCGHYAIVIYCSSMTFTLVFFAGVIAAAAVAVVVAGTMFKGIQFELCIQCRNRYRVVKSFILWCNRKEFHILCAICYCNKTTLLDFIMDVLYCLFEYVFVAFFSVWQIFIYLNDRNMCVHCIYTTKVYSHPPWNGFDEGRDCSRRQIKTNAEFCNFFER